MASTSIAFNKTQSEIRVRFRWRLTFCSIMSSKDHPPALSLSEVGSIAVHRRAMALRTQHQSSQARSGHRRWSTNTHLTRPPLSSILSPCTT
jgi:hypothetical protein